MSQRLVTGDQLNEILLATKDYIDLHDLGFEETDLESMDTEAPRLTLTEYGITNKEVDALINKYFDKDNQ